MQLTLAIPFAIAAIATALPQGPGGSRAVLGWCASGVPGCAYNSLYDCQNRGGKSYNYCTHTYRCENKNSPRIKPKVPSPNPNKRPTLPPSEQLPLEESEDKSGDLSVDPTQEDYTMIGFNEAAPGEKTTPDDFALDYETTAFTNNDGQSSETNHYDGSAIASTDSTQDFSDHTYYDDSLTAFNDLNGGYTTDSGEGGFWV